MTAMIITFLVMIISGIVEAMAEENERNKKD